jgi:hypothetical protein
VIRMTPFELSLGHELDIERQRFGNEWLFKWYCLNMEGRTVDVPSFDGGRITIGRGFVSGSGAVDLLAVNRTVLECEAPRDVPEMGPGHSVLSGGSAVVLIGRS